MPAIDQLTSMKKFLCYIKKNLHSVDISTYSRVPNKRTGRLLENEKKSHLYALIWDYSFINFQQKVPPIRLFSPIFLLLFKEFSHLYFYSDPSSIRNYTFINFYQKVPTIRLFPPICFYDFLNFHIFFSLFNLWTY